MKLDAPLMRGEVALVGAGPGDASLLTMAAATLIADCDVVVFDALVSDSVMAMADPKAEKIPAGKRGGRPSANQSDICEILIRLAKCGKRVVRLKGGDPFVFGRGGEEIRTLSEAGVMFRVVPGITSGVAAPAMAGIPVTDRLVNSSLAFLTGHEATENSRMDWKALVKAFPVLVFYMGAKNLPEIAKKLVEAGLDSSTPVAAIFSATLADEAYSEGRLAEAANGQMDVKSPSIIIIGDIVSERVEWRDKK
jgi:uroporphyrin-III C-methyltransferase